MHPVCSAQLLSEGWPTPILHSVYYYDNAFSFFILFLTLPFPDVPLTNFIFKFLF